MCDRTGVGRHRFAAERGREGRRRTADQKQLDGPQDGALLRAQISVFRAQDRERGALPHDGRAQRRRRRRGAEVPDPALARRERKPEGDQSERALLARRASQHDEWAVHTVPPACLGQQPDLEERGGKADRPGVAGRFQPIEQGQDQVAGDDVRRRRAEGLVEQVVHGLPTKTRGSALEPAGVGFGLRTQNEWIISACSGGCLTRLG